MAVRDLNERQRLWLTGELAYWQTAGLVSEDQAARILDLYGTPQEIRERQTARGLLTLASLAALLVGLGVLLLIAYNWENLPDWVELALVFGALVGIHAIGFALRYRLGRRMASEVVFFLACLFFGAAIGLVAQIFHINSDNPDGIWWWAVGTLPFALMLDTLLLHTLYVGLLALFAGWLVFGSSSSFGAMLVGALRLPHNIAFSVPLLALPGLVWAYRKGSAKTVALYAPLLAWWVILQPFAWRLQANPIYFLGCIGGLFLILAQCHAEDSVMAVPYRFYGSLLVAGVLVPLSYYQFNREVHSSDVAWGLLVEMVVIAIIALLLILAAGKAERWSSAAKRAGNWVEDLVLANRRRALPMGLTLFFVLLAFWQVFLGKPLLPTVLANVAMIALAIWLMQLGLRENRGLPFAAGVLYFLLWTVLRYIDLFGDFGGMVGAALMFLLCGLTLFGLAMYWRRRTEVRHV
jgi:uncharacterized membrane protein